MTQVAAARSLTKKVLKLVQTEEDENVKVARLLIAEAGIRPNQHVGKSPRWFNELRTYEWVLGQFANLVDKDELWCMNQWIQTAAGRLRMFSPSDS